MGKEKKKKKKKILRAIGKCLDLCSSCEGKPTKWGKTLEQQRKEIDRCTNGCAIGRKLIELNEELEMESKKMMGIERIGRNGIYVERIYVDEVNELLRNDFSYEEIAKKYKVSVVRLRNLVKANEE